jgi:hypothetical protein
MVVMNFTPLPLFRLRKQFAVSAQQEAAANFIKYFNSYFALVSEKHGTFQTLHPGLSSSFTSATSRPFNFIILINQLDATLCSLIYSLLRFTLHVSGALRTHQWLT